MDEDRLKHNDPEPGEEPRWEEEELQGFTDGEIIDPQDPDFDWDAWLETDDDDKFNVWDTTRGKWLMKIGAALMLLVFIAFSYAWLPMYWPPRMAFLEQNQELSVEEMVQACRPAVVSIEAVKSAGLPGRTSQGTGFNIAPGGLVVTNRHVVEGASSVEVAFSDNRRSFSQDIVTLADLDLAIIRLAEKDLPSLPVVTDHMAGSGDTVTIIGNPRGFQRVAARGKVDGYYRINEGASVVFTIDAVVEPGSSGSPVLDQDGRVVGIVFATGRITIDGEEIERAIAIPATALNELLPPSQEPLVNP